MLDDPLVTERANDLDLLRAYEPVIRFTKGELFLPTAVGPYVEQCSLWTSVILLIGAVIGVEAFARRRFVSFLASVGLLLLATAIGTAIFELFRDNWREILTLLLAAAAVALLIGNLRDLRHGWRRGGG